MKKEQAHVYSPSFIPWTTVSRMSDSAWIMVHSGMAHARVHAIRGSCERKHAIKAIEKRLCEFDKECCCGVKRVKMQICDVKVLFREMHSVPLSAFKG